MTGDPRRAARAIDALRRGWPVALGGHAYLPVETADEAGLAGFDPDARADVLIGAGRAAALKLANQRAAADPDQPVLIARAPWIDLAGALAIADATRDLVTPLKGPFRAVPADDAAGAAAMLRLARIAGLLPAYLVLAGGAAADAVAAEDIAAHEDAGRLQIATRARLPVAAAEDAQIVAFRGPAGGEPHVALVIGRPDGTPPLVRLHSECLTGDVFGSLKCDCGPQLALALKAIGGAGWGILLYLRQEGRGIGLVNKLRAYALQDQGFDTVDANVRLGLAIDARDFGVAARMLDLLGQRRVRLMTNNPAKVAGLEAAGVTVAERVAHALPANPFNAGYLAAKRDRTGHVL